MAEELISINRRFYDKRKTMVEIGSEDFTKFITGIEYTFERSSEFNYNLLGQVTAFARGNDACSGTLSMTDAGVDKLNEYARAKGLPNYLHLGGLEDLDITISYTTYDDSKVKTDILHIVHFTSYNKSMDADSNTNSVDVPMVIGQVVAGNAQ